MLVKRVIWSLIPAIIPTAIGAYIFFTPVSVSEFFSKNRAGASPDYGIVNIEEHEKPLVVVFGFDSNLSRCKKLEDFLNDDFVANRCIETANNECFRPYLCRPLN